MHVVVFPGWYPSRVDRLSGDFVQRHLQAISLYCKVSVVMPVKDKSIKKEETIIVEEGNLTEIFHYYPSISSIKIIDAFASFIRYNLSCLKLAKSLNQKEKISVAYLYVLQKNFLIGFQMQRLYKVPYVISECSTFYIDGRFDKISNTRKKLFKKVFQKSTSYHAVSNFLGDEIKGKLGLGKSAVIIPNVVDSKLFYYNNEFTNQRIAFVHVSNFTHQKNVEGMLAAFAEVRKVNPHFLLNLVGPLPNSIIDLISFFHLTNHVKLWNERSYVEVAQIMQQSDVFVFFSRHETFGCVIIEANACGLPIIVTDLPVTRELVSEGFNGVFVENENIQELTDKVLYMIINYTKFDPLTVSLQTRKKYNYERVGQQFYYWLLSVQKEFTNK